MKTTSMPVLAAIARERDYVCTADFGRLVGCKGSTARKNHHLFGECFGVRPIKVGNRLMWPVDQITQLLTPSSRSQFASNPSNSGAQLVPRRHNHD